MPRRGARRSVVLPSGESPALVAARGSCCGRRATVARPQRPPSVTHSLGARLSIVYFKKTNSFAGGGGWGSCWGFSATWGAGPKHCPRGPILGWLLFGGKFPSRLFPVHRPKKKCVPGQFRARSFHSRENS
eukprot:gene17794-biopygen12911